MCDLAECVVVVSAIVHRCHQLRQASGVLEFGRHRRAVIVRAERDAVDAQLSTR